MLAILSSSMYELKVSWIQISDLKVISMMSVLVALFLGIVQ